MTEQPAKRTILIVSAGIVLVLACWYLLFTSPEDGVAVDGRGAGGSPTDRSPVERAAADRSGQGRVNVAPHNGPAPDSDSVGPPAFEPLSACGWHLWGRVFDEETQPIEGVEVAIWFVLESDGSIDDHPPLVADFGAAPVATVRTDRLGRYGANVLVPHFFEPFATTRTVPGAILIRLRADGYLSDTIAYDDTYEPTLPYPTPDGTVLRVDFDGLEEGANLWGKVVAADGKPVFNAEIEAFDPTEDLCFANSTPDGIFSVPILSANGFHVDAHKDDVGANALVTGEIATDRDVTIPDLVLRGDGVIEGSVLYADGLPAADVVIWAWLDSDMDDVDLEPGEGLIETIARTGPDGRFTLSGLRAGPWAVEADCAVDLLYDEEADEVLHYQVGASSLRFVIVEHRLRVNLFDGEGRRLPHTLLNIVEMEEEWFRVPGGAIWLELEPGTYTYNAVCEGRHARRGRFVVDAGSQETRIDLYFQELLDPGRMEFVLTGPGGEATERQIEVYFANQTTGAQWRDWIWRGEEGRYEVELPPGVYNLDMASGDYHTELHGCSIIHTAFGKYRPVRVDRITVAAGESVTVARTLAAGDGTSRRVKR